ncbi:hypothetical protein [Ruegeria sp. AU67]|uniref:hypothetical protein n=1 Tax=Ruegeria sp. AU67 TaxID=2108530 RepID=UPI000D69E323|nr:hypothetical protein [Ruegeria sp. AU67]
MTASPTGISETIFSAQSVLADTVEYRCEITKSDGHGWIAPVLRIQALPTNHMDMEFAAYSPGIKSPGVAGAFQFTSVQ